MTQYPPRTGLGKLFTIQMNQTVHKNTCDYLVSRGNTLLILGDQSFSTAYEGPVKHRRDRNPRQSRLEVSFCKQEMVSRSTR